MEKVKARKSVVISGLVLLVLSTAFVEQIEAKIKVPCFVECMAICTVESEDPVVCAVKCGLKCHQHHSSSPNDDLDTNDVCQLGCVVSLCTNPG